MKEIYKQKINDLINSVAGKIILLERMTDGTKAPDKTEAMHYMRQIKKGLQDISDFVSIS